MECIEKHRHFQRGMPASSILNFRYFTCLLDKGHISQNWSGFSVSSQYSFKTSPSPEVQAQTQNVPHPAGTSPEAPGHSCLTRRRSGRSPGRERYTEISPADSCGLSLSVLPGCTRISGRKMCLSARRIFQRWPKLPQPQRRDCHSPRSHSRSHHERRFPAGGYSLRGAPGR